MSFNMKLRYHIDASEMYLPNAKQAFKRKETIRGANFSVVKKCDQLKNA